MQITQLTLENFRNIKPSNLRFHPKLNLIHGENGSGKTALLEALYFLGRGKSFRETKTRYIISHHVPYFRLIANLAGQDNQHLLGIERKLREYSIRFDGENLHSLSELANIMPIQIINSDNFALIDQGPEHRRRFIDYGLFYHNAAFLPAWQRYQYALKNRNAALRQNWTNMHIQPWHKQLEQNAVTIDNMRRVYLNELEIRLNHYHAELGGLESLQIHYQRGWAQDSSLAYLLDQNLERDRQLKHTRYGIHRAEWRITANEQDTAHCFSRGQQKTLICALILAQVQGIAEHSGKQPVILVDDIVAELDAHRRQLLMQFLLESNSQLFITTIENTDEFAMYAHHNFGINQGDVVLVNAP